MRWSATSSSDRFFSSQNQELHCVSHSYVHTHSGRASSWVLHWVYTVCTYSLSACFSIFLSWVYSSTRSSSRSYPEERYSSSSSEHTEPIMERLPSMRQSSVWDIYFSDDRIHSRSRMRMIRSDSSRAWYHFSVSIWRDDIHILSSSGGESSVRLSRSSWYWVRYSRHWVVPSSISWWSLRSSSSSLSRSISSYDENSSSLDWWNIYRPMKR